MFKNSFFYRYLAPFAGNITINVMMRILSAFFGIAVLACVVPFLSILFGKVDMVMEKPEIIGFSSESVLGLLKYHLSQFMILHGQARTLTLVVAVIGGSYLLKNFFGYWALYAFVPIKNGAVRDIRRDVYNRLLILPLSFYSKRQKGDLLARATADIHVIDKEILTQVEQFLVDLLQLLLMLAGLFFLNLQLAVFTLLVLPLVTFAIRAFSRKLKSSAKAMQQDLGQLVVQTEETISGIRAIKGYQAQGYFRSKFGQKNQSFYRLANSTSRRVNLASPISEFLGTMAIMGILIFGGWLILNEKQGMSPEILITFLLFLTQILNPAKNVSTLFYNLKKGKVSVKRIKTILNADEKITQKPNAVAKKSFEKSIVFRDVSFQYESLETEAATALEEIDQTVLRGISFTFEKNKTYAIVGPSGAGKTTIADLLGRFYDCTEGQILIDGIDIRDIVISDVRALSAYVSQDTILFNDTIANNILFGQANVSRDELIAAAKAAHAHEFIMNTENGYDTMIGDGGMKLSGGQRQRLSIARAILKNAPILILDEATSALDTESEKLVQDALSEIAATHTTIAIAHRLSTIRNFDQILVMDKGNITEIGTHAELLALDGLYAKLCRMQTV